MIKNIFASYVLPLILSGTSLIMPKDTNLQLYIGYACYAAAIIIFGFSLFKNYGRTFTTKVYNLINNSLNYFMIRLLPKNKNQQLIAQLSSEINENIRILQVFGRDYHRIKKGFNRPEDFSEIARAELIRSKVFPAEFRLSLPNWYQVVAEQHSPFSLLPKKVATQVEQFHLNLNSITKIYDQIKDIVKEQHNTNQLLKLRTQWETLVSDVLERGNPLKATFAALQTEPSVKSALVSGDKE